LLVSAGTEIQTLRLFSFTVSFIMMRNCIAAFLVLGLLLPALLPLAPHNAVHALYDAHIVQHAHTTYHNEIQMDHFLENENDASCDHENIYHHTPIDFASYYEDFLHIDLKHTNKDILLSNLTSNQDIDYDLDVDIVENKPYVLRSQQKCGPPIGHDYITVFPSIYLTTLRIRI